MPKYDNAITQAMVDAAADEILRECDNDIEKVNANQVATRLGMSHGNKAIYEKFAVWKKQRIGEGVSHVGSAPAHLQEALDQRLQVALKDIVTLATGMTGKVIAGAREEFDLEKVLYRQEIATLKGQIVSLSSALADKEAENKAVQEKLELANRQLTDRDTQLAAEKGRAEELRTMNGELIRLTGETRKPADQAVAPAQTIQPQAEFGEERIIDPRRYDLEDEDDDDEAAA